MVTLAQAEEQLADALAHLKRIRGAQQYSISAGTSARSLSRASLDQAQQDVQYWERKVSRLRAGGIRVVGATPT